MTAPIISWYGANNTSLLSLWSIGQLNKGLISPEFGILIWNNRGGSEAVADIVNAKLCIKSEAGEDEGDLVVDGWVEAKSVPFDTNFSKIGGARTKPLKAMGLAAGVISGGINDGTKDAQQNFAEMALRINVPANADSGIVNFIARVDYQYV
jgi:hypothetical protein